MGQWKANKQHGKGLLMYKDKTWFFGIKRKLLKEKKNYREQIYLNKQFWQDI